jgi:hypothetical protein
MFARLIMFCLITSFVSCASTSEYSLRSPTSDPFENSTPWNR